MTPLTSITAVAAPLLRDNVDTDAIIPSREIRSTSKTGLADGLFASWRYAEVGGRVPARNFVLNDPAYRAAQVLLAGANFGCGSSREHAAWALAEFGFRAVVAPSFNPIFRANCVRNGIAPVVLSAEPIARIAAHVAEDPQARRVTIDLSTLRVSCQGESWAFDLPQEDRLMLMEGLDPIDLTLKLASQIEQFREADRRLRPWIYI